MVVAVLYGLPPTTSTSPLDSKVLALIHLASGKLPVPLQWPVDGSKSSALVYMLVAVLLIPPATNTLPLGSSSVMKLNLAYAMSLTAVNWPVVGLYISALASAEEG